MNKKPILCLDFDGVCHSYTSGWQGADIIPDPPVPGLFEFLEEANKVFRIQIFSSRSNQASGTAAMLKWFDGWYANGDVTKLVEFVSEKPPAFLTIDDRAITFTGQWPAIEELQKFQPWYKKGGE